VGLGLLLIAEALLAFAPLAVLGPAIGWPASLGRPAAEQLAAVAAAPGAVALGYGVYLLYSVLIAPAMIGLALRSLSLRAGPWRPEAMTAAMVAAGFGLLSALARAIGILRWLTAMPSLAAAHAAGDAALRAQIELIFKALTSYGGGIGELLGVSLLMALSVGVLCADGWRRRSLPIGLAAPGLVVALMLCALFAPALGMTSPVPVAAAVTALSAWMLACGVWCLRKA
jgi:hypothetical protein